MKTKDLYQHLRASEFNKLRLDTGETMALSRQLLHLRSKLYDVKYATRKHRLYVPVSNEIGNGATRHSYKMVDRRGIAKVTGNYGDDAPRAGSFLSETIGKIYSIRAAYGYTVQDIRQAAMAGAPLDAMEAKAARDMIEDAFEKVAAVGDSVVGLTGLLNHATPAGDLVTAVNGSWTLGTSAGEDMIEDLNKLVKHIVVNTKDTAEPDSIILGTDEYSVFAQTLMGTSGHETALSVFLRTNPYIRNVGQWTQCDLADAAGTGPRAVCYKRDPDVLEHDIPQEFEQFAPEMRNMEFVIQCHARTAGVTVRYPKAIAYMDSL